MNTKFTAIDSTTLALMKIVERVVRPLRADSARKRKMRDELLAHLSVIYDEELALIGDSIAAVEAAAERFGDPEELSVEMQATVPRHERWEYQFESWFGWHAPETAMRWMTRLGIQLGLAMVGACVLMSLLAFREFGWSYSLWLTVRPVLGAAVVLPFSVVTTGICYYKMRDHLFGVFGSRKSWLRVMGWAALMAASMVWSGFVFIAVSYGSISTGLSLVLPFSVAGVLWSASNLMAIKFFGPQEIRDTVWALLDLDDKRVTA